jgi:MFS family permease
LASGRPAWQDSIGVWDRGRGSASNLYQAEGKTLLRAKLADPALRKLGWSSVHPNVVFLGITSLLTDISSEMVSSILPLYVVFRLHAGTASFGLIDGIQRGAAVPLALAAGYASDRWLRHKGMATIGYLGSALSKLALVLFGGSLGGVAAATIADRAAKGIRVAPRDALKSLSSQAEGLASAFGVHRALDTLGSMLGPIAAFLLLGLVPDGYGPAFVMSLAVGLVGVGVIVTFVRAPPAVGAPAAEERPTVSAAVGLLRDRRFGALVFAAAALGVATISDGFVYLLLQKRIGFGADRLPLLYVATPAVFMLLAIPIGRAADALGRIRVLAFGYACLLGVYACAAVPSFGLPQLAVAVTLLGAHYACTEGVLMALASHLLPGRVRASGLAIVSTTGNLARFAASVLFGWMWSALEMRSAISIFACALVVATGASVVLLARSREERARG